jgi:hypothetical protein
MGRVADHEINFPVEQFDLPITEPTVVCRLLKLVGRPAES